MTCSPSARGDILDGAGERGPEGIGDVIDDESDLVAAATAREVGGHDVGPEAQLAHGGHDPLGRLRPHARLAVDDA